MATLLFLSGCDDDSTGPDGTVDFAFDFLEGDHGWVGGFADYSLQQEEQMELTFERRVLPDGLPPDATALFLSGRNTSDDLFMFLKRRITGLEPDREHALDFTVRFASNAPAGCVGIGGPPGEAVIVKAGATRIEPEPVVVDGPGGGDIRMNLDKGNQSTGGPAASVLGDIATGPGDCTDPPWRIKTLESEQAFRVITNADGALWLLVGTDSGFEGTTGLFYLSIEVRARPL